MIGIHQTIKTYINNFKHDKDSEEQECCENLEGKEKVLCEGAESEEGGVGSAENLEGGQCSGICRAGGMTTDGVRR